MAAAVRLSAELAKSACLLNLLASLRIRPTLSAPLIEQVHDVFWISNDRGYARVHRDLFARLVGESGRG